jgi:hypothetical protein
MNEQDQNAPTDYLETISQSNPSTPDVPEDSPTSAFDAGLDDEQLDEAQIEEMADKSAPGEVLEDNESEYSRREIPITDLPDAPRETLVHSPVMADMSSPGEVDIEDLDQDAARNALPPDARLDRIEE